MDKILCSDHNTKYKYILTKLYERIKVDEELHSVKVLRRNFVANSTGVGFLSKRGEWDGFRE